MLLMLYFLKHTRLKSCDMVWSFRLRGGLSFDCLMLNEFVLITHTHYPLLSILLCVRMYGFFLCCVSVCLFRPEARTFTNCGWLVLARVSAGELFFYFAESPLTFISLHLLRDGDSKWQGLLSLFLLCLSVCPFSLLPPPVLTVFISPRTVYPLTLPPVSLSFCLPKTLLQLWVCASLPWPLSALHKVN